MTLAELQSQKVSTLRQMANGMPYRGSATKRDMLIWIRKYRPEVFVPPCDSPTEGIPYADICGQCHQPHSLHGRN